MKFKIIPLLTGLIILALISTSCVNKVPAGNKPALTTSQGAGNKPASPATQGGSNSGLPATEGGGGIEAASRSSLIDPGGLPTGPSGGSNDNSQSGEERMVKKVDSSGLFSILFVDTWTLGTGSTPTSLRSSQNEEYAEAEVISVQGLTPMQEAQALDASQANGIKGYQKLAILDGNVHGLPASSLIYQYEAGTNPVTGKPGKFIASQVFIGGGPANKIGHVTFSAPYPNYSDLSGIFDNILAGFSWK